MHLASLDKYQNIAVVGLGQTGLSVVRYLLSQGVQPVLFDTREQPPGVAQLPPTPAPLELHTGPLQVEHILGMDLLIVSPGIDLRTPVLQLAADAAIPIIGDMDLLALHWAAAPDAAPVMLGITGSNGKSTVTQLLHDILAEQGMAVAMGGNIGIPVLDLLAQPANIYVLELSSFQLELMQQLPLRGATILNVSDDHMDRYHNLHDYSHAKQRIYLNADVAVWNREQELTAPVYIPPSRQRTFGADTGLADGIGDLTHAQFGLLRQADGLWLAYQGKPLVAAHELALSGIHNLLNVQAALALAELVGVKPTAALATVKQFRGLAHRCELVAEQQGVRWVNDSKATNIGAAEAAIQGLRASVSGKLILIAGGDGKGADFSAFKPALAQVDHLIVLGKDAERIAQQVEHAERVKDLTQAVAVAASLATPGSMVLLSPACASLDMFNNYQQRGDMFRAAVEAYYG
ncbi:MULTISPECIES: UDP-N-acetylmuramoyl-L-alanine--D-glutamate ligase [Pseudidiomarina]|uniref:UDP-N-acetylmuramoylalanine--D-glutamate ligase n=2 Tax=Pseudidiomarina TaxID=2800384 RepID=A0A368UVP0_9GAMM|nr:MULTISPECIES: UDP-N-acetylmuramoyl-L-alanine--D-glutamate ligase [Pseudidiomarina]PWW13007.1 UDP-N-acetylmuramoylalanine--D-glutamate ligase [Pseudidiomarina maritima]RBP90459.1 UDP-N-acetylmuramoylalanine--D-glutamate ligase [Pseudidiomarina tainanensis]RCW32135.1 UDP-N-acetylmuramoylalanine--D-glutamate ligase [Pseudidiomarina tainanensis]